LPKLIPAHSFTTHSARNLGFIFDEHLTFSDQISALSKSCYYYIRKLAVFVLILTLKLPVPWPLLSFILNLTTTTHCTIISQSLIKNSRTSRTLLLVLLPERQSFHITSVLKSLQWLKINERIRYKLFSLTYKVFTTHQPPYLHDLISVQPCHNTRSSSMVTLARPPTRSSLKITNRSFR